MSRPRPPAETLALLDTLLASAPVGFAFQDREFRFVRLNEEMAAINGASVQDHIGRTVAEMVPAMWPQIEPAYERVLAAGQAVVNQELSGATAADPSHLRHWLVSWYPVRVDSEMIGIGVIVIDITERKEAEEAQKALTRAAVAAIAATVEARDPYTAGHQRRVADIAAAIGAEIGLDERTVEGIRLAANIHDLGKIGVPAEILSRPGRLLPAELELVKGHCRAGYEIVAGIEFPWPVAETILHHHERLDGSGYPDGLRGDEIAIGARVIAVADVVEAMASHRPYRPARGLAAALDEIENGRGRLFDPQVVDACLGLIREGRVNLEG